MSMLSSMCEDLRLMARLVREYDYREISRSMREAADTIDELRCRCQDAQAENEKLMEELEALKAENDRLKRFAEYDENAIDILNVCTDDLSVENAKLRELVADMYGYAVNREMELCDECVCACDGDCGACDEHDGACGIAKRRFEELYGNRIHELGIEVNDG